MLHHINNWHHGCHVISVINHTAPRNHPTPQTLSLGRNHVNLEHMSSGVSSCTCSPNQSTGMGTPRRHGPLTLVTTLQAVLCPPRPSYPHTRSNQRLSGPARPAAPPAATQACSRLTQASHMAFASSRPKRCSTDGELGLPLR